MNYNFIILCVFIFFKVAISFSQENNDKGAWIVTNYAGFATLKKENTYITNATVYGGKLGKEFLLKNGFGILAGLELQNISANVPNSDLHLTNKTIKIPVSVSYHIVLSEKTTVQINGGVYMGFLFRSKTEDEFQDMEITQKNLGLHFGIETFLGINHTISQNFIFQIGMISQTDLFQSFDKEYSNFDIENLYGFQIGGLLYL